MHAAVQLLALRLIAHAIEGSDSIGIHRIDLSIAMPAQDDTHIHPFNRIVHTSLILSWYQIVFELPAISFLIIYRPNLHSRFKLFWFQLTSNYAFLIIISCY